MQLHLTRFPAKLVEGAYKGDVDPGPGVEIDTSMMPDRMRMLETGDCAESFARDLVAYVVVSDMFRPAESSLAAMKKKTGVQPPSFSHHNYGRAIDLSTTATLARMRAAGVTVGIEGELVPVTNKRTLDLWLAARGWYCFRGDHKTGRSKLHLYDESWHFDYLGDVPPFQRPRYPYRVNRAIPWAVVAQTYGRTWSAVSADLAKGPSAGLVYFAAAMRCQEKLKARDFYHGAIDGKIGPQSRAAIAALQRAWCVYAPGRETGRLDPRTVQVLEYVTMPRVITDMVERPTPILVVDEDGDPVGVRHPN